MNKLEKFEKWCKFASEGFTKYDFLLFLGCFVLCALAKDLNLSTLFNVSGSIFLMLIMWYICTFICLVVLACIKKHDKKKTNIEKLIDEELKKG